MANSCANCRNIKMDDDIAPCWYCDGAEYWESNEWSVRVPLTTEQVENFVAHIKRND